jgi:hypothetical protein
VWGLEAFVAGYAGARGLTPEDPDELRRRIAVPFSGFPDHCLYGRLAGAVEGRLVLWTDHLDTPERGFVNLAIVRAPTSGQWPPPSAPFETSAGHGWLVVWERVDAAGRSASRLDGLAAEAARLAA